MRTLVLFHDAYARPTDDWFPWVKAQAEARGMRVIAPGFPQPPSATLASWQAAWNGLSFTPDADTIFVGHGLGAVFALRLIETLPSSIAGTILVAPYTTAPAHVAIAEVSKSFLETPLDWDTIKTKSGRVTIFGGSDDPFVLPTQTEVVAQNLNVSVQVLDAAGHMTRGSGFVSFVQLFDAIVRVGAPLPTGETITEAPKSKPTVPIQPLTKEPELQRIEMSTPAPTQSIPTKTITPEPVTPIKGIETMETAVAHALSESDPTIVRTALEGARRADAMKKEKSPVNPKNLLRIIGGLVLLGLGGLALVVGLAQLVPQGLAPTTDMASLPNGFLKVESVSKLDIATIDSAGAREALEKARANTPANRAQLIVIADGARDASFADTIKKMTGGDIPVEVQGFLDGPVRVAIIHPNTTQSVFVLMTRVRSYDGAFSALAAWESVMPRDIASLVPFPDINQFSRGLSTWTNILIRNIPMRVTTGPVEPPAPTPEPIPTPVESIIAAVDSVTDPLATPSNTQNISNPTPVPAGGSPAGEGADTTPAEPTTKLVYLFLDPETLAITTTPDVIPELIRRFSDKK
jgi:uncharacterized protein